MVITATHNTLSRHHMISPSSLVDQSMPVTVGYPSLEPKVATHGKLPSHCWQAWCQFPIFNFKHTFPPSFPRVHVLSPRDAVLDAKGHNHLNCTNELIRYGN